MASDLTPAPLPMSEEASGENQHKRMAPWKPSDTIDQYLNGNPGGWDWCLIDNLDPDDCRAIAIESIRRLAASEATALALHADKRRLERRTTELVAAMDPRSVTVMLRQERDEARARCAEQATTIATLEGIVKRLREGWKVMQPDAIDSFWQWMPPTGCHGYEPMTPAERIILTGGEAD